MIKPIKVELSEKLCITGDRRIITIFDLADKDKIYKDFLSMRTKSEENLTNITERGGFKSENYSIERKKHEEKVSKDFLEIVGDNLNSTGFYIDDIGVYYGPDGGILVRGKGIRQEEEREEPYKTANAVGICPRIRFNAGKTLKAMAYLDVKDITWQDSYLNKLKLKWGEFFGILDSINSKEIVADGIKKPIMSFSYSSISIGSTDFCARALHLLPHIFKELYNGHKTDMEEIVSIQNYVNRNKRIMPAIVEKELEKSYLSRIGRLEKEVVKIINDFFPTRR